MTEAEKQKKAKEVADKLEGCYRAEIMWSNEKKDAIIMKQSPTGTIKVKLCR